MGKLDFKWDEKGNLVIGQCDKMTTNAVDCDTCQHRFQCFTVRTKPNSTTVSTAQILKLSELLKQIDMTFDTNDERNGGN